jgi:hypothetical protein
LASIFDLFSNKNAQDAANAQIQGINAGATNAHTDLNTGLNLATGSYNAGLQPFQTNLATDQAGQNAYADATGANGAAGNQRAVQNFQTGPGYQFQLDQGSQNVLRNQAATGQLASGATNVDLQNYGQGQANQAYQQYIQNLQPFLGQSTANASGAGGLYSGLANLQNQNLGQSASLDYGAATSAGNAQANADLANNAAAANQFGALKSAASLGSTLMGFL